MLTRNQFEVLFSCHKGSDNAYSTISQRELVRFTGLSLGTINSTLSELRDLKLIHDNNTLTSSGTEALVPYKVDNAIIMAAGMSTRFAPISYEKPKGVLKVAGEILIERQIKQLKEVGINEIILVLGYKKEEFFYLEDAFGVKILINNEYAERNNNSSIKKAAPYLGNSYICSSDNYFEENPFASHVYDSYYAASFVEGETDEWCIDTKGKDDKIVGVEIGGSDSWVMLGHAYWSRAFSQDMTNLIDAIYNKPGTADLLWEHIYKDHMPELPPMFMKRYDNGIVWEFDSLDELRMFDPTFIDNVDSNILDNIANTLNCERRDIKNITPIKKGMTNQSFRFELGDAAYVYRHPGAGSEEITNRASECFSQDVAKQIGIDSTFIHENIEEGWKISRFIGDTIPFDYHNMEHVKEAMRIARLLHSQKVDSGFEFDVHKDTHLQIKLLDEKRRTSFEEFPHFLELAEKLNEAVKSDGTPPVLCHVDFYDENFLVRANETNADGTPKMDLIDWEFSGMSDYAADLGVFICCCPDYTYEDALNIYEMYFGRPLTEDELFHCVAYSMVVSFHWFIWALYKDVICAPVGEYLYYYYRYTKMFAEKALEMRDI